MDANDASGTGLQNAEIKGRQNKFPRKLWRINPGFSAHAWGRPARAANNKFIEIPRSAGAVWGMVWGAPQGAV